MYTTTMPYSTAGFGTPMEVSAHKYNMYYLHNIWFYNVVYTNDDDPHDDVRAEGDVRQDRRPEKGYW